MKRNSYFTFSLIVLLFSSISMIGYSQSTKSNSKTSNAVALTIKDSIIAPKPVSSELFGGMSAVSDGRPENMLSQMLFDRGFELTRSTFDNTDFQGLSVGDKKQKGTGKWESDGWKNARWPLRRWMSWKRGCRAWAAAAIQGFQPDSSAHC